MLTTRGKNTLTLLLVCTLALLWLTSCEGEHAHDPGRAEHVHPHPPAPPDRSSQPIMKNISVISVYTFDPSKREKGKISYELLEPVRTRIVITAKDDPDQLYRVLLWDWQKAGQQVVEWDGTDQSGYPLNRMECAVRTTSIAKSVHRPGTRVIKPLTTPELVQGLQGPPDHSRCETEKCKPMKVRFGSIVKQDREGGMARKQLSPGTVLSGVVTVEAEVAKDARGYGNQTGYGVRWMVDQQLVAAQYYEKESDGKFSYPLDTTAFRNGEHVFRVSTCDHYDHIGVTGVKVVFDNK